MFIHRTPWPIRKLYPQLTWSKRTAQTIYLTFDDGPIPVITPFIQQTLSKFDVQATFFCVGENIKKYNDVAQASIEAGHKIANHTFNHLNGWQANKNLYSHNIELCESLINKLGVDNGLFRPPYGRITRKQIKIIKTSYEIVMWDVLTGDFSNNVSPEDCLQHSINATRDGSIVLFHDNIKAENNLRYALPRYIEHFLEMGFRFSLL
ncbi:MAG: polysaccharide deacetylase family protein [Bacteroidota bacterium]